MLPPEIWLVCQMKSWRRFPSFLVNNKTFACSMTSRRSATRTLPSEDSFGEGFANGLDFMAEFNAMSICLFCYLSALNLARSPEVETYGWEFAISKCCCHATVSEQDSHASKAWKNGVGDFGPGFMVALSTTVTVRWSETYQNRCHKAEAFG